MNKTIVDALINGRLAGAVAERWLPFKTQSSALTVHAGIVLPIGRCSLKRTYVSA